jgi:hypothetical protein
MRGTVCGWGAALALSAASVLAGSADDDLAVVRKAVAGQSAPAPDEKTSPRPEGPPRSEKLRWLKIRVVEKAGKRVSVNVPLSVARALGDDWPLNFHCRRKDRDRNRDRDRVTLGEVLRSLESGQDIVQVESDEATLRVWVE